MKYIISESRLKKLVNTYLDSLNLTYKLKYNRKEFLLYLNKELAFEYRDRPEEDTKTLLIKYSFAIELCSILGLNTDELMPMVIDWVNDHYDTDLNHRQWNWFL